MEIRRLLSLITISLLIELNALARLDFLQFPECTVSPTAGPLHMLSILPGILSLLYCSLSWLAPPDHIGANLEVTSFSRPVPMPPVWVSTPLLFSCTPMFNPKTIFTTL